MRRLELLFERGLWLSRLIMLPAVVFSVLMAAGAFFVATIDALRLLGGLARYADPALAADARAELRVASVTGIIKAVDGYLIAAILLMVALGIYELFINRINAAERSEVAPRLLQVRSLDDLKDRLAKLILLVLIIEFFQRALYLEYPGALDLLYLAISTLLIGAAFYLTSLVKGHSDGGTPPPVADRAAHEGLHAAPRPPLGIVTAGIGTTARRPRPAPDSNRGRGSVDGLPRSRPGSRVAGAAPRRRRPLLREHGLRDRRGADEARR